MATSLRERRSTLFGEEVHDAVDIDDEPEVVAIPPPSPDKCCVCFEADVEQVHCPLNSCKYKICKDCVRKHPVTRCYVCRRDYSYEDQQAVMKQFKWTRMESWTLSVSAIGASLGQKVAHLFALPVTLTEQGVLQSEMDSMDKQVQQELDKVLTEQTSFTKYDELTRSVVDSTVTDSAPLVSSLKDSRSTSTQPMEPSDPTPLEVREQQLIRPSDDDDKQQRHDEPLGEEHVPLLPVPYAGAQALNNVGFFSRLWQALRETARRLCQKIKSAAQWLIDLVKSFFQAVGRLFCRLAEKLALVCCCCCRRSADCDDVAV